MLQKQAIACGSQKSAYSVFEIRRLRLCNLPKVSRLVNRQS